MRKRILLAWCVLICMATFPLGALLLRAAAELLSLPPFTGEWYWSTFALAQLAALLAMPIAVSPYRAQGLRATFIAIVAWTFAGHALWLAILFFFGATGSVDRMLLISTACTQIGLAATAPVLARFGAGAAAAIVACSAVLALQYPDLLTLRPSTQSLVIAGSFLLSYVLTYMVFIRRRGVTTARPLRFVVGITQWLVAAQLAWIALVILVGVDTAFPRWLPLSTGAVAWVTAAAVPITLLITTRQLPLGSIVKHPAYLEDPGTHIALERGPANGRRTAWIISYTGVSNEPRVLRQGRALLDDGWRVVVCGFDGHSPRPADWTYVRLPTSDPYRPEFRLILEVLRTVGRVLCIYGRPLGVAQLGARLDHWCLPYWMHIRRSVVALAAANPDLKPDLVLCNDFFTCDVGHALMLRHGAKLGVDCHEYAVEQYAHDARWAKWSRPLVAEVQAYYLSRADVVSTVCDGIADLLNKDHGLKRPVLAVRSVPAKQKQAFRPTGDRIKVLYHGGIWHVRQLHTAIESMRFWRPEFDLVLRGDGDPSYIAELRRLSNRYGLEKRVFIEPAVPFQEIIPAANKADIGYFSYANFSRQSQFVLPNKFFEYIMAGLALCVIDLTEMSRLMQRYDLGKCIPEHKPEAIASVINSFTRAEVDRCKHNALLAAEELNWEHERQVMIAAYNEIFAAQFTRHKAASMGDAVAARA